jgi:hypothetical protein
MYSRGFARRFAFVALAVAAPMLAVGAAYWAAKEEEAAAQQVLRAAARHLAARIDSELERSIAVLNTIAASNVLQSGDLKGFHELARRIVAREPQFENVQLLGTRGEHLVNARLPYGAALPRLNRPDLPMRAAMLGQPVVSDAEMAVVAKRVLTAIYVPVIEDGNVTHVLGAAIEPPNWTEVLRSVLPMGVDALLLDRAHFVITSTTGVPQGATAASAQGEPAFAHPGDLLGDMKRMRSKTGDGFYVAEETSRIAGWKVLTVIPRNQAGLLHKHWASAFSITAAAVLAYWGLLWVGFGRRTS